VFVLEATNRGTSSAPIVFRANPGENVVVSGDGGTDHGIGVNQNRNFGTQPRFIVIDGFEVRDFGTRGFCTWVRTTSDVVLRNLDVHGCRLGAVELHDTSRVTVENSSIHDNPMSGYTSAVDLYRCRAGNIVRNNRIWNNTDTDSNESEGHGVVMDVCKDYGGSAIIENNVIWNNEGWCVAAVWTDNATIRNNTCYQNGNGRAQTGEISVGNEGHRIHNNITVPRSGRVGVNLKYVPSNVVEYNLIAGGSSYPPNLGDITADPRFVNAGSRNFALSSGSPAIDSGDNNNAPSKDADGKSRPQDGSGLGYAVVDIGAYEYGGSGGGSGSGTGGGSDGGTGGGSDGGTGGTAVENSVNFDSPAPSGSSGSILSGAFGGIQFGEGQWRWEGAWKASTSNHIYFNNGSGRSRDFRFVDSSGVLTGAQLMATVAGTVTISDEAGQTFTRSLPTGQLINIQTGWTEPSGTITVNYTAGWELALDNSEFTTQ
jgi:hypothetical protein